MKREAVFGIMLTLFLAGMLSMPVVGLVKAGQTILVVHPQAATATVGQTFSINITINDVCLEAGHGGLRHWIIWAVRWDPNRLQLSTIEEGPFLKTFGNTGFWFEIRHNEIRYMECWLWEYIEASGSGTLATITFNATVAGKREITLDQTRLYDSHGIYIPHSVVNGTVTIPPPVVDHNVAVASVILSGTEIYEPFLYRLFGQGRSDPGSEGSGHIVEINATVENSGNFTESFNVTAYYDTPLIETYTVTNLAPDNQTTLTFTWNVTYDLFPGNYIIKVIADPVQNETYTADNTYIAGTVIYTWLGDFDGDFDVDIDDIRYFVDEYILYAIRGIVDPVCDTDQDGNIDIDDIRAFCVSYIDYWTL